MPLWMFDRINEIETKPAMKKFIDTFWFLQNTFSKNELKLLAIKIINRAKKIDYEISETSKLYELAKK